MANKRANPSLKPQILDRANQPEPVKGLKEMKACNDAYFSEMKGEHGQFAKLKEKYAVK